MTTKHIYTTFSHQNFEKNNQQYFISKDTQTSSRDTNPPLYKRNPYLTPIKSTKGWGLLIDLIELSFRWKLTDECGDYFPIGGNYRTNVENSFCHIYLTVYVYVCMRNILCIFDLNPKEREIQTWFNGVKYG